MSYNYEYSGSIPIDDPELIGMMGGFYVVLLIAIVAVGIAAYVLQSLSLHTIAKRRGLNNPWLAWLPVGDVWILGSISDQYRYLAKGEVKSKRKILLWLSIVAVVCSIAAIAAMVVMIVQITLAESAGTISNSQQASLIMGPAMVILVVALAAIAVSITMMVFRYMSLYDLFRSCDPNNATAFLCVSIVGGLAGGVIPGIGFLSVLLEPIFLMIVRKKDGGMPPRKQPEPAGMYEEPVSGPEIQ